MFILAFTKAIVGRNSPVSKDRTLVLSGKPYPMDPGSLSLSIGRPFRFRPWIALGVGWVSPGARTYTIRMGMDTKEASHPPTLAERGTVVDATDGQVASKTRRKVPAVGKGVSQMAWMRKAREEKPNVGRSCTRDITTAELQAHNKEGDAWMAVRGRVYDVTPYLEYHPGGRKVLEEWAGTDATKVFNQYHAWVNAEYILASCQVGKLKTM